MQIELIPNVALETANIICELSEFVHLNAGTLKECIEKDCPKTAAFCISNQRDEMRRISECLDILEKLLPPATL